MQLIPHFPPCDASLVGPKRGKAARPFYVHYSRLKGATTRTERRVFIKSEGHWYVDERAWDEPSVVGDDADDDDEEEDVVV